MEREGRTGFKTVGDNILRFLRSLKLTLALLLTIALLAAIGTSWSPEKWEAFYLEHFGAPFLPVVRMFGLVEIGEGDDGRTVPGTDLTLAVDAYSADLERLHLAVERVDGAEQVTLGMQDGEKNSAAT